MTNQRPTTGHRDTCDTRQGLGMKPIELCDKYAGKFQALNRKLRISNDFFVRTTQPKHYLCVFLFLSINHDMA